MNEPKSGYQVLARKYRPNSFADLVGQDAMVRTLRNAFAADRIAQAFILTGIRGTGKTTTARIIAKGMNCIGPDGTGAPTTEPCGVCDNCVGISEGRHVDVYEMDAASHTGVDDIRDIIESVHYRAVSSRYKIYIIDEVHMLSTNAFNALLKTLEEPPPHVKFIFATTEIRKVPVTVLSRCQRFDLRRIEPEVMIGLLRKIADKEQAEITDDALALITRAAEGSARDATSLLDQAISHGAGTTKADQVRAMLGLADRGRVIDLFELVLRGDVAAALIELQSQYADGGDPVAILRDLADVTHWVSVVKISPESLADPTLSPDERERGRALSAQLPMRALTRMWQMLLKALEEVSIAPNPMMAAEMAIIRLTHIADLPDPEALIRKVQQAQAAGEFARPANSPSNAAPNSEPSQRARPAPFAAAQPAGSMSAATALAMSPDAFAAFPDFASVVELIRRMGDLLLLMQVEHHVALVRYSPGRIEFEPRGDAPAELAQKLAERLRGWSGGHRWAITVTQSGGAPTIAESKAEAEKKLRAHALDLPMVRKVMQLFPDAKLHAVTKIVTPEAADEISAGADIEESTQARFSDGAEWDPFEEED